MADLIDLNLNPDERALRRFGLAAVFAFGLLAALVFLERGPFAGGLGFTRIPLAAAFASLGATSGACSLLAPRANRPLYVALSLLTYPIGLIGSRLILLLLYFGVVAPIGLGLRLLGRDPLQRRFERDRPSYWSAARPPRDKASYFRQF